LLVTTVIFLGTKQKSAENAMQQISLAQTEYYSDNSEYYTGTETGKLYTR